MNKLKGFTQLNASEANSNYERYKIWKWNSNPDQYGYILTLPDHEPEVSGWNQEEIPARNHECFNNFLLWFEYEE